MKAWIDFSVFSSPNEAVGNVSGFMDVQAMPVKGDVMLFGGLSYPDVAHTGFMGVLTVAERRFDASNGGACVLSLEDIVVNGRANAIALLRYFSDSFGLDAFEY